MKQFVFLCLLLSLSTKAFTQDTRYIRDMLYVSLRSDQSNQSEVVLSSLPSGTRLILLEQSADESFSLVQTESGIEGWLQSQYLSDTPAAKDRLEALNLELDSVNEERDLLKEALNVFESEATADGITLGGLSEEVIPQQNERDNLSATSVDALILSSSNQALTLENEQLRNQIKVLNREKSYLQDSIDQDNFWNGVIAVFLGIVITLIIPKLRPSKRNEWR